MPKLSFGNFLSEVPFRRRELWNSSQSDCRNFGGESEPKVNLQQAFTEVSKRECDTQSVLHIVYYTIRTILLHTLVVSKIARLCGCLECWCDQWERILRTIAFLTKFVSKILGHIVARQILVNSKIFSLQKFQRVWRKWKACFESRLCFQKIAKWAWAKTISDIDWFQFFLPDWPKHQVPPSGNYELQNKLRNSRNSTVKQLFPLDREPGVFHEILRLRSWMPKILLRNWLDEFVNLEDFIGASHWSPESDNKK